MSRKTLLLLCVYIVVVISIGLASSPSGVQVPDYYGVKNITCPCIGYYGPVDFPCLFEAVKKSGPIENKCLQIITEQIGEAAEFKLKDLGTNLNDCDKYQWYPFSWDQLSSGERQEPCRSTKKKFELIAEDRRFYDLVALNLEKASEQGQDTGSLLCRIYVYRMKNKTSRQCYDTGIAEDSCKFNPSISYKDGIPMVGCGTPEYDVKHVFEDGGFHSSFHYKEHGHNLSYFAFKPDEEVSEHQNTTIKMTYLIGSQNFALLRIGMSCTWETVRKKGDQSASPISNPLGVQSNVPRDHDAGDSRGVPVQSNIELIFGKVFRLKRSDGDIFSDGAQNLRLNSLRVYADSSLEYVLQWDCPDSTSMEKDTIKLLCLFGFSTSVPVNSSITEMQSWSFGPLATWEVPMQQQNFLMRIQTGFDNRTSNGILKPLTDLSPVTNMLKYDYYRGDHVKYGNHWHKKAHDREEDKFIDYFKQSVLLPGTQYPEALSQEEIHDLKVQCHAQVQSQDGTTRSSWSKALNFDVKSAMQPVKVIATTGEGKPGWEISYRNLIQIAHYGEEFQQKKLYKSHGVGALVGSTHSGVTYIKGASQKKCDDEIVYEGKFTNVESFSKTCGHEWDQDKVQTEYNMRRVGCYHWMFNRWYVFHADIKSNTYDLVYHEGDTGESYWHEIAWRRFNSDPKTDGYPTDMKCSNLHSFLIWSEYDADTQIHFMKVELDPISGDVISKPEEIEHRQLCKCSTETVDIRLPTFDLIYPDLNKAEEVEITVLCEQKICSTQIGTLTQPVSFFQSHSLTDHELEKDIMWFAVDQLHIYYYAKENRNSLSVQYYGHNHGNRTEKINSEQAFYSIHSSKDEQFIPVSPLHCLRPIIMSPIRFTMVTNAAGRLLVATSRNSSEQCNSFAKLRFAYKIQFSPLLNSMEQRSINDMWCIGKHFPEEGDLDCKTKIAKTRNDTMQYVLGNLMPNRQYFIQVTVSPDMDSGLIDKWYAGTQWASAKIIANATFVPAETTSGYGLEIILGVSVPIIIVITILWLALWLWYRRRMYIYQHLARLAKSEIHRETKLGEGHFGEVWKARIGKQIVVVKTLKESANEKDEKEFRDEALLISKFQSDHIIKTLGICLQSRPIMLALEYANGGALDSYLRDAQVRMVISSGDLLQISKDIASACIYLEAEGFVHRDIAARNCLVFLQNDTSLKPKVSKLSDFGLAKDTGKDTIYKVHNPDSDTVPVAWTAPEGFFGMFSSKSDVWAFGVLIWEIFSFGSLPYGECIENDPHDCAVKAWSHEEIEFKVCISRKTLSDFGDPCFSIFNDTLKKIMAECWKFNPSERPSFKHLQKYLRGAQSDIQSLTNPDFNVREVKETNFRIQNNEPQTSKKAGLVTAQQAYNAKNRNDYEGIPESMEVACLPYHMDGIGAEVVEFGNRGFSMEHEEAKLGSSDLKNSVNINLVPLYKLSTSDMV